MMGQEKVFFFPSSYRRAVKYGQRDAANEILRTEVLARLSLGGHFLVVTYPDALAELVVAKQNLDERILKLTVGQQIAQTDVVHTLRDFELKETDYVYEPGQFAVRGSILDVYSYSCEYPFRIDFFGDEIDTIRTFDVETQLSQAKRTEIEIVPELAHIESNKQFSSISSPKVRQSLRKTFLSFATASVRSIPKASHRRALPSSWRELLR